MRDKAPPTLYQSTLRRLENMPPVVVVIVLAAVVVGAATVLSSSVTLAKFVRGAPGRRVEIQSGHVRQADAGVGVRIRLAFHYALHKGVWTFGVFTGGTWLHDPASSPFLDDEGDPTCPIELVSANVDRENNRYGEACGFLDQQDELNHRRSKYLHAGTQRQTHGRKGAVPDVAKMKRELAKPDGHVEWEGEEFGKDFGLLDTSQLSNSQVALYQDAKAELDSISFNAQLAGERQQGDLSGRAIDKLQAAGTIELNSDYAQLGGWENRVYRQVWARIKQFWTEEKWIRVTDDRDSLVWVGLNAEMTLREYLEDFINDESNSIPDRRKFAAVYTQLIQAEAQLEDPQAAELASARLDQVVPVKRNDLTEVTLILPNRFQKLTATMKS